MARDHRGLAARGKDGRIITDKCHLAAAVHETITAFGITVMHLGPSDNGPTDLLGLVESIRVADPHRLTDDSSSNDNRWFDSG